MMVVQMCMFAQIKPPRKETATVLAAMSLTVSDAFRPTIVMIARQKMLPFESWCRTNHRSDKGSAARRARYRRRTRRTRHRTTLLLTSYRAIAPMYVSARVHTCNRAHDRPEGQGPQRQENR